MMPVNDPRVGSPSKPEPPISPFDHIYAENADLLRYLARRRFRIPEGEIEPLVQDTFVAYLTDPAAVRDVRGYLVGTICNRCRKYWSRHDRERTIFRDAALDGIETDNRAVERILDRLALDSALARLQPRCREVLTRYYRDHESVESIAAAFDTKAAYIHKLLHGCRKRAFEAFRGLASAGTT
jgi:RNA polymerase sigma factor (sigma-70 family)